MFLFFMASASLVPAYHYGTPWMKYHSENLVVYDCRLQSDSIPVGTKYAGRISELFVEVGDSVEEGDLIAKLDVGDLVARKAKAELEVAMAEANHKSTKSSIDSAIKTLQTRHECMEAKFLIATKQSTAYQQELKLVKKQFVRAEKLAKRGSISKVELERTLRELQQLESKVKIASDGESVAQLDMDCVKKEMEQIKSRSVELQALEVKVAIAKSEMEVIRELEEASTIKARTSGIVTAIERGAGSSVRVGDPIVHIQGTKFWSEIWINESNLAHARIGSEVKITLKAYPEQLLEGKITAFLVSTEALEIAPQASTNPVLQADAKLRLRIELFPTDIALIPGLTGRALLKKDERSLDAMSELMSVVVR